MDSESVLGVGRVEILLRRGSFRRSLEEDDDGSDAPGLARREEMFDAGEERRTVFLPVLVGSERADAIQSQRRGVAEVAFDDRIPVVGPHLVDVPVLLREIDRTPDVPEGVVPLGVVFVSSGVASAVHPLSFASSL
ncbi:hypothetical protein BRD15_11905, partial [Halobacteriales archaeon SW_6_65_15]